MDSSRRSGHIFRFCLLHVGIGALLRTGLASQTLVNRERVWLARLQCILRTWPPRAPLEPLHVHCLLGADGPLAVWCDSVEAHT